MKTGLIIIGVLLAMLAFGIFDRYRRIREMRKRLREEYGGPKVSKISQKRLESLGAYRDSLLARTFDIDEITWNDLEMERVFKALNRTCSAVGEEYLYAALFRPEFCENELKRREELIRLVSENEEVRINLQIALSGMGKIQNLSLYQYLTSFDGVKEDSNIKHLIPIAGWIAGIIFGILGNTAFCAATLLVTAGYSIVTYYKRKGEIEPYLQALMFVSRWVGNVGRMRKEINVPGTQLDLELESLEEQAKAFASFRRGSWILAATDASGDPAQMILEYIRMLTHVDLIKFNLMHRSLVNRTGEIRQMFEDTGRLDMAVAIASYRAYRGADGWCIPELTQDKTPLAFEGLCHPMIEKPVPNSLTADGCVLLTGSNASGKSTFLKTVAINAILAQTIHTVLGRSYSGMYYRIFSSMALRDDLAAKESYYIVEIRSLKRILDAAEEDEPVLCFVDEVLRGTNTAERIAASSNILRYISDRGAQCFAATHDLELTEILKDCYAMYHFSESVTEEALTFDYTLKTGKATSRNAILLLKLFGYPQEIVDSANKVAEEFLSRN
jgi:Mismatch repair ATPase (MutS family)